MLTIWAFVFLALVVAAWLNATSALRAWKNRHRLRLEELSEAIPPAYTQHIGEQISWHLETA